MRAHPQQKKYSLARTCHTSNSPVLEGQAVSPSPQRRVVLLYTASRNASSTLASWQRTNPDRTQKRCDKRNSIVVAR